MASDLTHAEAGPTAAPSPEPPRPAVQLTPEHRMRFYVVYGILASLALGIILSVAQLATALPQYASTADGLVTSATAKLANLGVGPWAPGRRRRGHFAAAIRP